MLYGSQRRNQEYFLKGKYDVDENVNEQTIFTLQNYLSGREFVDQKDLPILLKLAESLVKSSKRKEYQESLELYYQILGSVLERQEMQKKMQDVDAVIYTFNNKPEEMYFEPDNIIEAQKTVLADQECPKHIKDKTLQQIEKSALILYSQSKKEKYDNINAYKRMADVFNLKDKDFAEKIPEQKLYKVSESYVNQAKLVDTKFKKESKLNKFAKKVKESITNVAEKTRNFVHKHSAKIVVGLIAVGSVFGIKMLNDNQKSKDVEKNKADTTKIVTLPKETIKVPTIDFGKAFKKIEIKNNINTLNTQPKQKVQENKQVLKTTVEKDYYDTSLMIHLGSKKAVQNLYNKIDSLIAEQKIKKLDNLSTKRYAHSFTMYRLIRPNSAENKAIQNLLSGGKENPDLINHLVLKAKPKGSGVKPNNMTFENKSNFNKASKALQMQHIKNLQSQR